MNLNEAALQAAKRKQNKLKRFAAIMRPKKSKHDFSAVTLNAPDHQALYIKALNTINVDLDNDKLKEVAVRNLNGLTGRSDFSRLSATDLAGIGKTFYVQESGGELSPATEDWIEARIEVLTMKLDTVPVTVEGEPVKAPRKNIQDYIKDNTYEFMAQVDEWLDTGQLSHTLKSYLKENNVKALNVELIDKKYTRLLIELVAAIKKTDDQVVEAYSKHNAKDLQAVSVFLAKLIKEARDFVSEKISMRKPRVAKPVTPEKKVKKMKFAANDAATGLVSLPPTKLVGATQAWVYNTKTRKLTVYNSLDLKAIDVKGSSLLNWNEKTSITKNVRKPEQLKALVVDAGKVQLRKAMDALKAKSSTPKGRINEDTLILRVEK